MFIEKNKIFIASFIMFFFISNTSATELKIAITQYPPHVNVINGQIKGPVFQYLNNIFNTNFEHITFIPMPSRRAIRELNKGTVDLLFPYEHKQKGGETIGKPILNVVPGICFKKDKFIPILSAPGALNDLNIGVPPTLPLVPIFSRSSVNIKVIEGSDVLNRGIQLLLLDRLDGFYHPSPINVYHHSNPLAKKIACSLFYGYSEPVNIALSPKLSAEKSKQLKAVYKSKMNEKPYEHFLLDLRSQL